MQPVCSVVLLPERELQPLELVRPGRDQEPPIGEVPTQLPKLTPHALPAQQRLDHRDLRRLERADVARVRVPKDHPSVLVLRPRVVARRDPALRRRALELDELNRCARDCAIRRRSVEGGARHEFGRVRHAATSASLVLPSGAGARVPGMDGPGGAGGNPGR